MSGGYGTFIIREARIVYASAGALTLLGRTSRELLGRPFLDFVVEEDRQLLGDRHGRRVRGELVPNEYETTVVAGDGSRRVVECTVAVDGADVLLQLQDVTAQAARRPRLDRLARLGAEIQREHSGEAVFERLREGLAALGLGSFLLRAEPTGVRVVWARLPDELAATFAGWFGRPLAGYLGPWTAFSRGAWEDGVAFTDEWALHAAAFIPAGHAAEAHALLAERGLSRAVAIRLDERAEVRFHLVVAGDWLRSGDVAALRLFGAQVAAGLDAAALLDDLRRRNAQLRAAQEQVIQSERLAALGELSAIVAHEVRNPLGVIFNSVGSLRRLVPAEGDARMLVDIVQEEADRLNRLVGDLLAFARPSTPELRPERLGPLLDEAIGAAVAGTKVTVARAIPDDLPAVPVDAFMVRQAVLNLAQNAAQAMPRGGRLEVAARVRDGAVEVELADSGPGIPETDLPRLFEPFFTTRATGTGLGLALVKRIVEGHGGDVRVESRPGEGTRFRLRLPLSHPAAPAP